MRPFTQMLLLAALLVVPAPSLFAQTAVDPSGHWEGAVQAPGMEVKFEIDLTKDSKGELAGTFSTPTQNIKGLPLASVAVEGKSVSFHARRDQTFTGVLSADGKSMSGDYSIAGHAIPFSLVRTGDAKVEARPRSAPIGKGLEGTWNGTLDVNGISLRLVLTMTNQPDGMATGSIVNLDQGGLEVPIANITHKATNVMFDLKGVAGSYSGALNAAGSELVGTFTQGPGSVPLTFRIAKP